MNTDDAFHRRFVHSRLVDATPEQVFTALSQPERLARWWGPDGFSSTFETFDFRTGGSWRFVMHAPDGTRYPNANVFRVEIEHLSEDHHFVLDITLVAQGSQTLMGWEQTFDTVAHRQVVAPWVESANEQNLDRLQREVEGFSKAAVRAGFAEVWEVFPDAHWGNARYFVHSERGVSEWTFTGTRADGTQVEVHGCDLFTFRDGKIFLKNSYRKNRPPLAK